jgi:quinol monooxygenase YgiN
METQSALREGGTVNELFIFARFHAKQGREDELVEELTKEVSAARQDAGCLAHSTYRSTRDSSLFFIHSRWTDEAAFENHLRLPHTQRFAERVELLIDHKLEVTRARPLET